MQNRKHQPRYRILVGSWHLLVQLMQFGNRTFGGFVSMDEALREVALLNKKLAQYGIEIFVSAHLNHELAIPSDAPTIGELSKFNNPRAILLNDWIDGIKDGTYAKIGRIIPAGFGYPWSDQGAFINPVEEVRQLTLNNMVYAFSQSTLVKSGGFGLGKVIYWDGPDGVPYSYLTQGNDIHLGHDQNPELPEWNLMQNGLISAIKQAIELGYVSPGDLLFESKPGGDPCYLGLTTDTFLEIKMLQAINNGVDEEIGVWQGEFCHSRGSGQKFSDAMNQVIAAKVWRGQIHLNSGGLGQVNFSELLSIPGGTPASRYPQYVDNDFLPGEGVSEWVEDQKNSLKIGAEWSANTGEVFEIECDSRFCRYTNTIQKVEESVMFIKNIMDSCDAIPAPF